MRCLATLVAACVFLAGCGSGGSGGSGGGTQTFPLSSTYRHLQPGDSWDYRVSISGSASGSGNSQSFISTTTVRGVPALVHNTTITGGGQTQNSGFFFTQDSASRDILNLGKPNDLLNPPQVTIPGAWQQGTSYTKVFTFESGDTSQVSLSVIGSETVSVPFGTFRTWKTTQIQSTDLYQTSGSYWYAPKLGNYVKARFTVTATAGPSAGQSFTYDMQLTGTNVPP